MWYRVFDDTHRKFVLYGYKIITQFFHGNVWSLNPFCGFSRQIGLGSALLNLGKACTMASMVLSLLRIESKFFYNKRTYVVVYFQNSFFIKWAGSMACCWYCMANCCARWTASWALMVNWLRFMDFYFLSITSKLCHASISSLCL